MLHQSFRQVFVSNIPVLLPEGQTVENIAVGQVAIVDGKTYKSTTTPTYGKNPAIQLVWGMPDLPQNILGGPNQNEYSKLIKGKLIRNFRGKRAARGQNQIVTVGFSGDVSDTDTLFAKPGHLYELFLNVTGETITKEYSNQGIQRRYYYRKDIIDDCVDTCVDVDPREVANFLAKQINSDKTINRYVKVSVVEDCTPDLPAQTTRTVYKFRLITADNKDNTSLGLVQAQYPGLGVKRVGEDGLNSVYEITRTANTLPAAFSNAGTLIIPDCDTCPAGYTLINTGFAYKVTRQDAGNPAAQTAIATEFGIDNTERIARTSYEYGQSVYTVVSDTALADAAGLESLGEVRQSCILTTPATIAWVADGTLIEIAKTYRLTLADDICGNDRLADVQAAYPDNVVTLVDAAGDCVHSYDIVTYSQPLEVGCGIDVAQFQKPRGFEGAEWRELPEEGTPDGTVCKTGLRFEVGVVHPTTNEITFDSFPYDASAVFLEVSSGNQDYSDSAVPLENLWAVKYIQAVKFPQGAGAYIQKLEQDSLAYALKFRSQDAYIRQLEAFEFQAKQGLFYDEYVLEFDFSYMVGGWSQRYTDSYSLFVYFPEGQGKAFETAINSYLASSNINIDPVIL